MCARQTIDPTQSTDRPRSLAIADTGCSSIHGGTMIWRFRRGRSAQLSDGGWHVPVSLIALKLAVGPGAGSRSTADNSVVSGSSGAVNVGASLRCRLATVAMQAQSVPRAGSSVSTKRRRFSRSHISCVRSSASTTAVAPRYQPVDHGIVIPVKFAQADASSGVTSAARRHTRDKTGPG